MQGSCRAPASKIRLLAGLPAIPSPCNTDGLEQPRELRRRFGSLRRQCSARVDRHPRYRRLLPTMLALQMPGAHWCPWRQQHLRPSTSRQMATVENPLGVGMECRSPTRAGNNSASTPGHCPMHPLQFRCAGQQRSKQPVRKSVTTSTSPRAAPPRKVRLGAERLHLRIVGQNALKPGQAPVSSGATIPGMRVNAATFCKPGQPRHCVV